jgi:hypothetical protein
MVLCRGKMLVIFFAVSQKSLRTTGLGYSPDSESQLESQKSVNQKEKNLSADSKQDFAVVLIYFYKLIALKKYFIDQRLFLNNIDDTK